MSLLRTVVIFDWDDTLFPTTWLSSQHIDIANFEEARKYMIYFNEVDNRIYELLKKALALGDVMIVTNAHMEWIRMTKRVLPKSSQLLDVNVKVISARDNYQYIYDLSEWKVKAFTHDIFGYINWANNIISIGDARYEYDALVSLSKMVAPNVKLKTIKFIDEPSFDSIIDQLNMLHDSLDAIHSQSSHLDLIFKRR
jgi:hypothetical protein